MEKTIWVLVKWDEDYETARLASFWTHKPSAKEIRKIPDTDKLSDKELEYLLQRNETEEISWELEEIREGQDLIEYFPFLESIGR